MPREVKAYLCAFKCGRHATMQRKTIERHEAICWLNPEARACKTCAHHLVERGDDPEFDRGVMVYPGAPGSDTCELEMRPDGVIVSNCPQWEAKAAA